MRKVLFLIKYFRIKKNAVLQEQIRGFGFDICVHNGVVHMVKIILNIPGDGQILPRMLVLQKPKMRIPKIILLGGG